MLGEIIHLEKPLKYQEKLQRVSLSAYSVLTLSFKINKTAVMIWKPHPGKTLRVKTEGPSQQSACWVAVAENSGKVQSELSHPLLWDTSSDPS